MTKVFGIELSTGFCETMLGGPWTLQGRGVQTQSWRATVLLSLAPTCLSTPAWKFKTLISWFRYV